MDGMRSKMLTNLLLYTLPGFLLGFIAGGIFCFFTASGIAAKAMIIALSKDFYIMPKVSVEKQKKKP